MCNIFSELTPKAFLLFFRRKFIEIVTENFLRVTWKPNRTLSIIFVLKIRFRENPLWNKNLKLNVAWKYALRDNPNFADKLCVEFFKFRKYYAAHNSGLKIWLVSEIFEMAQLVNLKFCVYLCWLGAGFSPQFSSRRTLCATYFPNLRRKLFSYFFRKKFIEIVTEKSCVIIETRTELCR